MKYATVTETDIQAAADTLLAEGRAGTVKPTVSALAARTGITRPTLYRNYPALIDKFLATATAAATTQRATRPRPSSNTNQLHERITKLRTENQQLRLHLDLYEEHIRRLTIDNDKLRTELGQAAGVTAINPGNHVNRRS